MKEIPVLLHAVIKHAFMKGLYTILLLIVSNVFMTFAWYGQLKLLEIVPSSKDWPLFLVILMSWGVDLFEY